jgi:hypothetical protein
MVVINLETTVKPHQVLAKLDPLTDNFVNGLTDSFHKYLANDLLKSTNITFQELLSNVTVNRVRPVIYAALKNLWETGWDLGSTHGRQDISVIYKNAKRSNFADEVELITFAKDSDSTINRLRKQIQDLVDKQEDNQARLNQLNKDINNPVRYAKKRLGKSSLTNDEKQTVVNILNDQANSIQQQQQQLKQQQDLLKYQLDRATGKIANTSKQIDMLSTEEVNQISKQRKLDKQISRREVAKEKANQRQQDLLTPITSNSSPISQLVTDLRNQRIRQSEINRDVSKQLSKPISLAQETEFAKYLDKRYNDLANKLAKETVDSTKQNIRQYINKLSNTKNKINTYLSSTKSKRERDLIAALSPMYPDYGKEARKIIQETKGQRLSQRDLNIQRELNPGRDIQQPNIRLNADQARRLGLGDKATIISINELNRISQKKSNLHSIRRTATTELSAAYNYGRYAHYVDSGIELVKWNVAVEHLRLNRNNIRRKSGQLKPNYSGQGVVCRTCLDLSERNIGYGAGVYPVRLFQTNQMLPPPNPHPNCGCYLEPFDGRARGGALPLPKLAAAAILGGATIASLALLNSMFNKTRNPVKPVSIFEAVENLSRPVLETIERNAMGEVLREVEHVHDFVDLVRENTDRLRLQAPPDISDGLNLPNEKDRAVANRILDQLEEPVNRVQSKYNVSQTVRGRNTQILNAGSRSLGNDISVLNTAQQLSRQSETIRQQFEQQYQAAQGNSRLQSILLSNYTKHISAVSKAINDLDISQIKLINSLNATKTALEETKETMQRYGTVEALSPGTVNPSLLVDNTSTVRRLTDQANTLYNNILNTQSIRQEYSSTLRNTKDALLNNPDVANVYLQQKARELNFVDTIFEETKGRITLSTNLDTAQEYIDAVKQRITNKASTNPVEYEQSMRDLLVAQEQLNSIRSATSNTNLDLDLLSNATQNPTLTVQGQLVSVPFSQEQVSRVKSKFDSVSNLESEVNNLQAELSVLKSNSPKAKDQPQLNPRQLEKPARLNELTREMGSLIYEQQGLLSTNPRYQEINVLLRGLNQQKQEIETAYFKQNLATVNISTKKRITVNGYEK